MNIPFVTPPRTEVDVMRNEFDALHAENQPRTGRYNDYEQEYKRSRNGESLVSFDYGRKDASQKQRHNIPLNFAHSIIQKHTFRIAGRLPDIIVPRGDNSALERHRGDTIEKVLYAAWRYSKAPVQFASGAHHCSLLGAACFDVYYDIAAQMPRFREIHPGSVYVIPGVNDPHDFKRVYRWWTVSKASFVAEYGEKELSGGGNALDVKCDANRPDCITIIQQSDKARTVRFAGNLELERWDHNYGFAPYVVIPNLGPLEEVWGLSDYEFFRDAAMYYEQLNSRMADVAEGTAGGAIQDFGSGQPGEKVLSAYRKGGVIPVKKDSQGLKPVESPTFGPWVEQHFQAMRDVINDTSFTPPAAWGEIGAATSGSDRALQLGAQLELTGLKQINWSAGLERINEMLLRMIEQKQTGKVTMRGTQTKGYRTSAFSIVLDAARRDLETPSDSPAVGGSEDLQPKPWNPADLIAGDYCSELVWQNRLDRDDPQFVLQELNKYSQAAQSLYTTLEKFGVTDPEEEIRLIEAEATRMPWLRQGMIALIKQQLDAASGGGGGVAPPSAAPGDLAGAMDGLFGAGGSGTQGGALNTDAQTRALNGSDNAGTKQAGTPSGAAYGAA